MSVVNTLPSGKRFPFLELPDKSLWVNFKLLARDVVEKKKIARFRSAPYTKPIVVFAAVRSNPWVINLVEECCMTS